MKNVRSLSFIPPILLPVIMLFSVQSCGGPSAGKPELIPLNEHLVVVNRDGTDLSTGTVEGVEAETGVLTARAVYDGDLLINLYYPEDAELETPLPAVLMVSASQPDSRNRAEIGRPYMHTNQVLGWSQLIAERGLAAVTYECGSDPEESLVKIADWLETNGSSFGIDPDNIGFWACSNSCISAIKAMREKNEEFSERRPAFEVLLYGDMMAYSDIDPSIPLFVVRAEKDVWADGELIEKFVSRMKDRGAEIEYHIHPGDHAFECSGTYPEETREIIRKSLDFMVRELDA